MTGSRHTIRDPNDGRRIRLTPSVNLLGERPSSTQISGRVKCNLPYVGKDRGQHGEGLTSAIDVPFYVGVVMPG
jgi:hypothetical protein